MADLCVVKTIETLYVKTLSSYSEAGQKEQLLDVKFDRCSFGWSSYFVQLIPF